MNAASFTFDNRTEDLLLRYFDGTLTTSEKQEFTSLLNATPSLQEELRRVQDFDTFLDNAHLLADEDERVDAAFLVDMQRKFGSIVIAGAAITTSLANATQIPSGASSSPTTQPQPTPESNVENSLAKLNEQTDANDDGSGWLQSNEAAQQTASQAVPQVASQASSQAASGAIGMGAEAVAEASVLSSAVNMLSATFVAKVIAGVAFVGATAYGVWNYVVHPAKDEIHFTEQTIPTIPIEPGVQAAPPATQTTQPAAQQAPTRKTTPQTQANTETNTESSSTDAPLTPPTRLDAQRPDANTDVDISSSQEDKALREKETLRQRMRSAEAQGDRTSAAFAEKSLGVLLREQGQFSEATTALDHVLKTAQALKLRELEADTHGELGKLHVRQGQAEKAVESFQKAVDILGELGKSPSRWQRELQKLERR
jgi:tetratricopeptide (TPR) repeat protein